MADTPYPITSKDPAQAVNQMRQLIDELYQERIAGALVGDVFTVGEDDILTLGVSSTGGLEKTASELAVKLKATGGLGSSVDGLYLNVAAKGDLLAGTADNVVSILSVGTAGQVLTSGGAGVTGLIWSDTPTFGDIVTENPTGGVIYLERDDLTVVTADYIGTITWMAKDTDVSGGVYQSVAHITVEAAEDFDDANDAGVSMSFWVNQIGAETPNIEMQLLGETLKIDHIAELTGGHGITSSHIISTPSLTITNLTDGYIPKHTSDALGLENSIIFQNAGNTGIGIGTVVPDTVLHVCVANATPVLRLERNDVTIGTDDIVGRIEVEGQDTDAPGICATIEAISQGTVGETGWRFSAGTAGAITELMRLDYLGNLGLGVVDPDAQFHIEYATGAVQRLTNKSTTITAGGIIGRFEFETKDAGSPGVAAVIQGIAEGSAGEVGLAFETGVGAAPVERIRIDHDGNVILTSTDTPTADPGWAASSTIDMTAPDIYFKFYVGVQAYVVPGWVT